MANTITVTNQYDSGRYLHVLLNITGDTSGEESATSLVDVSARSCDEVKLMSVQGHLNAFDVVLSWDATADVDFLRLDGDQIIDLDFGPDGISNTNASGWTGDVVFDTSGLGAETGWLLLKFQKKYSATSTYI